MKLLCIILLLSIQTASSFDFSKYTMIDKETKEFLRMNRQKAHPDSAFNPGVISVFGNSITIEHDFWSNLPESSLGVVPGTLDSTYLSEYKCAYYGNTIWDASMCVNRAVTLVRPEVVIMMYGVNEALGTPSNQSWEVWKNYYGVLLDSLLSVGTIPIISTIPPLAEMWDSMDFPVDTFTLGVNDSLRSLARQKNVVLVDYNQAVLDYTEGEPFSDKWYSDTYVHPSGGCEPDTSEPICGYGIRNAVCWHAVNKVYRIIIEDGIPDTVAVSVSKRPGTLKHTITNQIVTASVAPGTSTIRLSYNRQDYPQSIRVLDVAGRMIAGQVVRTTTGAQVTIDKDAAGICIVETIMNGSIYRNIVLLVP